MSYTGYIAALVPLALLGAGWLTGREWLLSFTYYGTWGTIGLTAAILFLTWLCTRMVAICQDRNIASLSALFIHMAGEKAGPSLHFLYQTLLLLYGGVLLTQLVLPVVHATGASPWIIVFLAASLVALLAGSSVRWLTIVAVVSLVLSLGSLILVFSEQRYIPLPSLTYQMNLQWFWQAILFSALHFMPMPAILVPLSAVAGNPETFRRSIWLGGTLTLLLALLIHLALLAYWHDIHTDRFPLLTVFSLMLAGLDRVVQFFSLLQGICMLALWLWGQTQSLAIRHEINHWPLVISFILLLVIFAVPPLLSHSSLLSFVLTVISYAGTVWLAACISLCFYQKRRQP